MTTRKCRPEGINFSQPAGYSFSAGGWVSAFFFGEHHGNHLERCGRAGGADSGDWWRCGGGHCSSAAAIIGKRFADQKRLQEKNAALQSDLFFLLAVEDEHCQRHGQKIVIRESVRKQGFSWSGKFTPGRVKAQ